MKFTTPPHSKVLRKGRISQSGGVYLLTWATDDRMRWFSDWILGRLVVASLRRAHDLLFVESLAFVVMPDHVHWLVSLKDLSLAELLRGVKSHSGFHVKQHIRRQGKTPPCAIWQEGYHDRALRSEESLQDVARYVVMNPLRAGLVKSVREYSLWDAKWL